MKIRGTASAVKRLLVCGLALMPTFLSGSRIALAATENGNIEDTDQTPYHVAMLNYQSGHYEEARKAVDEAEAAKPGDLAVELLKARILTEQHEFAEGQKLLQGLLTPNGPIEAQDALGDLLLRKRDFGAAAYAYGEALRLKPDNADLTLKLVYASIGSSDFIAAGKYASRLKPLDSEHPCYYFAKAALAQATDKSEEAEEDIQTARTIFGITATNRYLKTYLEVFSTPEKSATETAMMPPAKADATAPSASTNAAPKPDSSHP